MDRRHTDKEDIELLQTSTQQEARQKDHNQAKVDGITNWLAEEKKAREAVLSNELLAVIAGSVDFNPYISELASAVSDALSRHKLNENQARTNVLKLQGELRQLMEIKTESEDSLTGNLHKYYIDEGMSEARLRSFSEYLDSRFDGDVEKIAKLMSADPARFGGLVAMDQPTLEQVAEIETPDWLVRPIIISLAEPLETDDNPHLVIEPKDLTVYSLRALERRREDLSKELEQAVANEEKAKERLDCLKKAEELRAHLLSRFVGLDHIGAQQQEKEALLKTIANSIRTLEQSEKKITEKKTAVEESEQLEIKLRDQKAAVAMKYGRVEDWIRQYSNLELWRAEVDQLAAIIVEKTESIELLEDQIHILGGQFDELREAVQACRNQLENLASNELVPAPTGDFELPELPSSNLFVLQIAYFEADRALNQAATENGVSALEEKLRSARTDLGDATRQWEYYLDRRKPDMDLIYKWKAVGNVERGKAKAETNDKLINYQASAQALLEKVKENNSRHDAAKEIFRKHCRSHKVEPSLDVEAIREQSINVLLQKTGSRHERAANECKLLDDRATKLRSDTEQILAWETNLNLAGAWIGGNPATGPSDERVFDWPQLTIGEIEFRVETSAKFEIIVKDLRQQLKATDQKLDKERNLLDRGFSQVKRQIEDKSISDLLFELVQNLLNTDAGSLAYQTADFIESCDRVIRNLKMDVEAMDDHVSSLVNSLIDHANDCYQALMSASNAMVPRIVPVYGGETILRVKARLDFVKHREAYREAMLGWFYDAVEKDSLPQANKKKGDELGASLLYRLLACTGKLVRGGFEIELLKMAGQAGRYVPIHKDLSSGGEGLTSATMLYSVISHIRSRQRQHIADGNSVGFLFMDNPLSKASKASFVHAQLRTCVAFGIQPIFVTGVGDIEALEQFSNRIVITKSDGSDGRPKHLKINNEVFNRVVITEELLTEEVV